MSVPKLNVPSLSVPTVNVPTVNVPRLRVPTLDGYITSGTYGTYKKKERRHVKDLGDLLLGNPITGTRQLRETLIDYGAADLVYVPVLNRIAGALLSINERTLMPLAKGDFGTIAINSLESWGSSLDTLANPVKSLMPWAGGGTVTDLYKSMGWIDSQYRETYQYDTGYWLADVALEMVSDPLNWFSWGSKGLSKKAMPALEDTIKRNLNKYTGKALIGASDDVTLDNKFVHNLAEILSASTADADDKLIKTLFERVQEHRRQLDDLLSSTPKGSKLYSIRKNQLKQIDLLLKNDAEGILTDMIYDIRMSKGYQNYSKIRNIVTKSQKLDTDLLKASLIMAPAASIPALAIKYGGAKAYQTIKNAWLSRLKNMDTSKLYPNNAGAIFKDGLAMIFRNNEALHKPVFDKFKDLMLKYSMDPKRLQLMYLEIYDNLKGSRRTTKEASKIFVERLLERMPDLKSIYYDKPGLQKQITKTLVEETGLPGVTKGEFDKLITDYQRRMEGLPITPDDLDELTTVLELAAVEADELGAEIDNLIMDAVETDFKSFLADNSLYDTPINKIHYALTRYMQIDGVQYNLNNIEEFIADLNEKNPENFARIMAILDYLGITVDTAHKLSDYLESTLNYNRMLEGLDKLKTRLSNLHRDYRGRITVQPDANLKQLELYINEIEKLINTKNVKMDDVTSVIKRVQHLLLAIEEVPGSRAIEKSINRVRVRARAVNKINKLAKRFDYTDEITSILLNNKQGGLPIRYSSQELQRIFKDFSFNEPKINIKELSELRTRFLGHTEAIVDIDADYTAAREFQTKFMSDLSSTVSDYKGYLDDLTTPVLRQQTDEAIALRESTIADLRKRISEIPEPDPNLSYADRIEARAEKTALEEHLAALEAESTPKPGILTELNDLDRYPIYDTEADTMANLTPSQLLNDIFQFELSGDYDLKDFDEMYEVLKRRVKSWRANVGYDKLSSKAKQFVDDLNNLFVETKAHKLYSEQIANLMLEEHRLYYMMLSKTRNPALLFNAISQRVGTNGTWSEADKLWFEKLLDPKDNTTRDELLKVAKLARELNYDYLATDIEHILASLQQLQAYAAIENTLRIKYSSKLSKEQCNYIINLIYNELVNSKLRGGSAYNQGDLERFMRRYKEQYYRSQYKYVEQSAADIARKNGWIDDVIEQEEYFSHAYSEEDLDYYMSEFADPSVAHTGTTETEYIAQFTNELMADVRDSFSTYLATLNYIAQTTNAKVTVKPMINYDYMMNRIKELAEDYAELRSVITDEAAVQNLDTFVRNMAGTRLMPDDVNAKSLSIVDRLLSEEDAAVNGVTISKLAPNLNKDGLFDIMRQSFRDLSTMNINLAGKTEFVHVVNGQQNMRKFGLVTEFITYEQLDDFVRATGYTENIYDFTLANDYGIAFKSYKTPEIFWNNKLYNNPADTTGVFRQFVENYRRAYAFLSNSDKGLVMNKLYLDQVRQTLIEVYLKSDAPYAPKDAISYFKSLNDMELRAWDMVTRVKPMNDKVGARYTELIDKRLKKAESVQKTTVKSNYTFGERIDYNEDPMNLYRSLEQQISNNGFTEESAFKEEIETASYKQFANIREYAATAFKQWVKDPETLLANSYNITQHIKNNVEAWENIRFIDKLTQNNNKVKLNTKQLAALKQYGITKDTAMNDKNVLRYLTRERSDVLTNSFKTWSAADIRSYLDHDTQGQGFLIFVDSYEVRKYRSQPYLLNRFTPQELAEAGIEIYQPFKEAPHVFVIRKSKGQLDVRPRTHKFIKPEYVFSEEQAQITSMLESNRHYYEYGGNSINPEFYTGEVIDLDTYDTIMGSKELTKVLGNEAERRTYSRAYAKGINNNFVLNTFIIGSSDATNELYTCMAARFQELNKTIPYHSNELPRIVYTGTHMTISRANNIIKYLELYFNQDYYLGADHFVQAFKKASDSDIKNFFTKGNFVAMVAKEAKDGSPAIYKYEVFSRKTLNEAIKQGAVAVPYEVYRNAVLTVNKKQLNAKLFNIYKRTIVGTFKTIYLTTAGFLMRNEADSAIYKNMASTEGVSSMYEVIKYQKRAWDMWKRYSDIQKHIIDSTKKDVDSMATLNKRATRSYLSTLSEEDRKLYMIVDTFVNSSASGGYSKALEELLLGYNTAGNLDMEPWEIAWNEKVLNAPLSPARWVMDINSQIEQTSRLALFLKVVDESGDYAKAIKEVVTTHFDYELKEPGMELMEDIFWFSTFPINNMAYYLNEGLTRNPDVFKMYMDMLEQSWDNDDITWDDVRNNGYYAYNVMRGNLRFKIAGNNFVLKTGNSVMDYLTLLMSPFEEIKERLNPFASVLLGIEPISELSPLTGTLNRVKQLGVGPGKSLIPSVYTQLYPQRQFNNNSYRTRSYNTKTWHRYPKKLYANSNQSYIKYKYITNAYSMRKRSNSWKWLFSTTSITPNWYHNNYRRYKVNSRLNRAYRKAGLPVPYI